MIDIHKNVRCGAPNATSLQMAQISVIFNRRTIELFFMFYSSFGSTESLALLINTQIPIYLLFCVGGIFSAHEPALVGIQSLYPI